MAVRQSQSTQSGDLGRDDRMMLELTLIEVATEIGQRWRRTLSATRASRGVRDEYRADLVDQQDTDQLTE